MGLLLLLAGGSGWLLDRPAWGRSWIGLALGALLVLFAVVGGDDGGPRRSGPR